MAKFIPIKYGYVRGPRVIVDAVPVAASVVFTITGGQYVTLDGNGRLTIATSATTKLFGHAVTGAFTASSTAGVDSVQVDVCPWSVYRLPSSAAPAQTNLGTEYDFSVSSNKQSVNLSGTTNKNVKVVDLDLVNSVVDVMMSPTKWVT